MREGIKQDEMKQRKGEPRGLKGIGLWTLPFPGDEFWEQASAVHGIDTHSAPRRRF